MKEKPECLSDKEASTPPAPILHIWVQMRRPREARQGKAIVKMR